MKEGKKVIFLINTLGINWGKKNPFYSSLNFFLAGRVFEDVGLSDLGFEEQISLGEIYVF